MKTDRFSLVFALGMALALGLGAQAAETATVKKGKINVRGQASLMGETITQLSQGETVTILEEIDAKKPKKGEPAKWAKILLPANTPVWVFAPYIDATSKTVNINRVNVRGGPGENFSILARLERGTPVKETRTVNHWMEIEAPTNCYAFVALDLLEKTPTTAAAPEPAPAAAAQPAATTPPPVAEPKPEPKPTTVETVETEPPVAAANDRVTEPKPEPEPVKPSPAVPTPPPVAVDTAPATVPQVEVPPPTAPAPKRIVIREGRVVYSRSIQAPTKFALESQETHRLINYLHTEQTGLNLKSFAGRKVVVTGEELLDARWAYTPILEVDDISVAK